MYKIWKSCWDLNLFWKWTRETKPVGRIGSWPARAGTQRPMARRSNLHRGLLTQDWAWPTARWPDLLAAHGAGAHARGSVRSARSACAWHGGVGRRPSGTGRGKRVLRRGKTPSRWRSSAEKQRRSSPVRRRGRRQRGRLWATLRGSATCKERQGWRETVAPGK
jgi:hypothetical protein